MHVLNAISDDIKRIQNFLDFHTHVWVEKAKMCMILPSLGEFSLIQKRLLI